MQAEATINPFATAIEVLNSLDTIDAQEHLQIITPEVATVLLTLNTNNRPMKDYVIRQLVGALKRDEWDYNGQPIIFDRSGNLIDGQHRLTAIVRAGIAAPVLIVHNIEVVAQETMDIGTKRTFADMLKLRGEKNVNNLAATTRSIWAYLLSGIPTPQNVSPPATIQQLFALLEEHGEIRDSIHYSMHRDSRTKFFSPSVIATMHFIFLHAGASADDVHDFFRKMIHGIDLSEGDPVLQLRNRLLQDAAITTGRMHLTAKLALMIKAFNHYMAGTTVKQLRWTAGGATKEKFPQVVVPVDAID